jgi:putative ABC transport system permease protein
MLLDKNADPEKVQSKMDKVSLKYIEPELKSILGIDISQFEQAGNRYGIKIQPLRDIHLNNEIGGGFTPSHDSKYLLIFSFVAILILVIASINFMNLSTARSANRAKEVGIRKVVGSSKYLLIRQFLWESMLLTLASLLLALLMVELLLPMFNDMIDLNLRIDYFAEWYIVPALLLMAVIIGLLSGSYPSFILSAYKPVDVLKGEFTSGKKGGSLRNVLVVVQFAISIIIISGTFIVYQQLNYMTNRDLGFNKDQVMVIKRLWPLDDRVQTFMKEVEKVPGVAKASNSTQFPGEINNNNGYQIKGRDRSKTYLLITNWTDEDFAETYEVPMVEGRYFNRDFPSDSTACVINETAVKNFGIEDPLNTVFLRPSDNGSPEELGVIGVIKDYHLTSLRTQIEPAIYSLKPANWGGGYGNVKLSGNPSGYAGTIENIENLWNEFVPGEPFLYFYLDEHFRSLYNEEIRTSRISLVFSILAVVIATLGLFGLTLFNTEKRTKEIGIRKVMGAGSLNIILLILKDIAILLAISTAIAWTASWFIMNDWLEDFPYRINPGIAVFLFSAGIAFLISFITVGLQARNAAGKNPADSLQYE